MTGWDIALLAIAGYLAAMALVRLTLRRRQQMYDEIRRQIAEHDQPHRPKQQSQHTASHTAAQKQ